jgi:hypothetical protein
MAQLRTAIISDEGLDSAYYSRVSIHKNGTVKDSTDSASTTLVNAGIIAGDIITVASDRNQATKQKSQEMMLDIAQLKRRGGISADSSANYYREYNTYDVDALSLKYSGSNLADDADTINPLQARRPWITASVGDAASITSAVSDSSTTLQIWYDGADISVFQPTNPSDGQGITQWNDKSAFAHNANPVGGVTARPTYETNELNSKSIVQFDGTSDCLSINPIAWAQGLSGYTLYIVAKGSDAYSGNWKKLIGTDTYDFAIARNFNNGRFSVEHTGGYEAQSTVTVDNSYHYLGVVFDGTATGNANRLKFRVDGTQDTLTFPSGQDVGTATGNGTVLHIGCLAGNQQYWGGGIAEILIFNRTLTAGEITNIESYLGTKWGL